MGAATEWVAFAAGILLAGWALKTAKVLWWTPRNLEKKIRALGIDGTSYTLRFDDLMQYLRLLKEARCRPMTMSHDIASRVIPFHSKMAKTYGRICMFWMGTSPRIVINDPALVRKVLTNSNGDFERPELGMPFSYVITGLAALNGEKWARHRKIVSAAFHAEKLKRMQRAFSFCCVELVRRWESFLGPHGSCEFDVWPEIQNFSRDVISRAAFGSSSEEGKVVFQLQDEQSELAIKSFLYFKIPGYSFLPTKMNQRLKAIDVEMNSMLTKIISKRENSMKQSPDDQVNDDLLGLLLQSNEGESCMNMEGVINECKLFYFAGQETTSILLTWTMVLLGMNPNWQDRARAEVLQVFGKEKPDFERLSRLKIVTMILNEVLRLYSPVLITNRCTKAATKLEEYDLPAGLELELCLLILHHDPDYWGEDSMEFNPQRFSEGASKAAKNPSLEGVTPFFPFGVGPRICPGQGFTMLEAKMGLASILQRFSFQISPAYTHAPCFVLTLRPQHGAQIILRRL